MRVRIEGGWPVKNRFRAEALGIPWNGWATPAFSLDVMREVAAAFGGREIVVNNKPAFAFPDVPVDEVVLVDDDGLYRTDGWVWELVE